MLDNLTQRLARVVKTMRGEARLTEANTAEMLREVRLALLEADVALPVVREFIARVKEKALGEDVITSLSPGQALVGIVHNAMVDLIGGARRRRHHHHGWARRRAEPERHAARDHPDGRSAGRG